MAERIAVYAASRISARLPELIFREQREGDTGLNAHLEIVEEYPRMGKMIGLQIRSDENARLERSARGYVCRGDMVHLAYWLQHAVPVLVMIYEQKNDRILWEFAGTDTIEIDGAEWELVVPHDHVYGSEAVPAISELPCYSPYLSRLALDRTWMELIEAGRDISVELEEWINRPSDQGTLRLCVGGASGGGAESIYDWAFRTAPDMPHVFRLPALFPWASLSVDEDFYREKESNPPSDAFPIRPWTVEAGEIARFTLKLSLNELGRSFLTTERFLRRGEFPRTVPAGKIGDAYESGLKFRLHKKA
ncbi:MAG: DUF4365 domain-containing protein [Synergistaceae bacterium]|jgi:hypothetical protein|nr:DUF4365 domain-containing protein [Synergistaceae bacterium]